MGGKRGAGGKGVASPRQRRNAERHCIHVNTSTAVGKGAHGGKGVASPRPRRRRNARV